jgi:hypothetical protein
MKVAVPDLQHSPMFGQLPEEQMVWSLLSSTILLTSLYCSSWLSLEDIRIQWGNRDRLSLSING